MTDKICDFGKVTTIKGKKVLTYIALQHPLPPVYRNMLIDLGRACIKAREEVDKTKIPTRKVEATEAYTELVEELEKYEMHVRKQIGIEDSRELIPLNYGGYYGPSPLLS